MTNRPSIPCDDDEASERVCDSFSDSHERHGLTHGVSKTARKEGSSRHTLDTGT